MDDDTPPDSDTEREASDWGCIGCLVEEFVVFPLALLVAAGIRTWLGWGAVAWRDILLAMGLVALFWAISVVVGALLRRQRP